MLYRVLFVVQADDLRGALDQAEEYLNTGDRVIDCDVALAPVQGPAPGPPRPAPHLPLRGIPRSPSRHG